jgi:hypothetical protein
LGRNLLPGGADREIEELFGDVDRRGHFPFARGRRRRFARQFTAHLLGFLVGDELLLYEQVQQGSGILRSSDHAAEVRPTVTAINPK